MYGHCNGWLGAVRRFLVSLWGKRADFLWLRPPIGPAGMDFLEGRSRDECRTHAAGGGGFVFLEGVNIRCWETSLLETILVP